MSIFESLAEECIQDEYFIYLLHKAELINAKRFYFITEEGFNEKEYIDLLRFSDILSRSKSPEAINKAYKAISLLADTYKEEKLFTIFAKSILLKIGNFPAIKYLEENYNVDCKLPIEQFISKMVKEDIQKIPNSELIFTDSQYEIFERLKNSNHFSFSGPTSLGKSFIINAFIRYLISEHKGTDNLVILVPTRALIGQIVSQLKNNFSDVDNYKILAYPKVPLSYKVENFKFIFVFTPERLLAYLSNKDNPKIDYLFIDEAHKVISKKDSRSPLYYHAILQAEKKSVKLFFASPNIPNPELFLSIFDKSTDENLNIKNSPVSQNRYYMDFLDKKCIYFSEYRGDINIPINFENKNFFDFLVSLSRGDKSIVYCNTKKDTIEHALDFAKNLPERNNKKINELITVIRENLHKDYYLIDCLKKGVGFHFGNLPHEIREKVEDLFSKKDGIDYLFCTSTLLEGVNLPAKNIFILSNAIGLSKFTDVDFWNLAGRAGRMTKELSGNIICARIEHKENRWINPDKDLDVARNKIVNPIDYILISGKGNFYKNIENSIKDQPFTRRNASNDEKNIWNHYANIAQIHEILGYESTLRSNFIDKIPSAKQILSNVATENIVPYKILSFSPMIKIKYQNNILSMPDDSNLISLTDEINYNSCLDILNLLYKLYGWEHEESTGKNPMCRTQEVLKYYAVILSSWMNSTPLNLMIKNALDHYEKKGEIWDDNLRTNILFSRTNKQHTNIVINELISDIDNVLRFKLKNYFDNYYLLLKERQGGNTIGVNWADFLEYGTNNYKVIELQNIGFSRTLALTLLERCYEHLKFEGDELVSLQTEKISLSLQDTPSENKEFREVMSLDR
ncbi:DEAD/DEAH box helicase [Shewanella xiamenensis]|uniref:DEAD/DEAH box helicase n=1 Tax=Shewanella xiamenensis TaxID=332186 RepID=UPI001F06B402|nr:DEAD/DEAH box helicase [Shewanella xiamenensis]UML93177.1 DEAD/DEAH box helicase [Shewanella xiamenensis]